MTEQEYPRFLRVIREPDILRERLKILLDTAEVGNHWEDDACKLMTDLLTEIQLREEDDNALSQEEIRDLVRQSLDVINHPSKGRIVLAGPPRYAEGQGETDEPEHRPKEHGNG